MRGFGAGAVGVAAVRRRPDHAAEQVTQVLLGEPFVVLGAGRGGEWLRVRLEADGYVGWLRTWHAVLFDRSGAAAWRRRATLRVRRLAVAVRAAPRAGAEALAVAPWSARLQPRRRQGGWWLVALPDGRRGFVRAGEVVRATPPGGIPSPARLERTARSLLGVPYEWGGRSSWGMDCSGYVQAVFAWHGVRLPRDAWQQARALRLGVGREPAPDLARTRPASLLFFGSPGKRISHVGLLGRGGVLLHALGRVRADALRGSRERQVKQIFRGFRGARAGIAPRARGSRLGGVSA